MNQEKTTEALDRLLQGTKPSQAKSFIEENIEQMATGDRPFAEYFRSLLKKKNIRQQDVFLAADISEGYGYKLISGEKHTRQRDTVLRLCFGGHLALDEVQRAMKLYGMTPLYSRIPRDAVLIIAINASIYEITDVDDLLVKNGLEPLYPCS